ncbi:hypothetical protein BD626DRAFT_538215 [Schizophyllum amplum]|uniref:AB hydrolase-1 domain-containing protein n=1 Tax=Schizophyllum amplum TaxID=97359 RepID=A0A550C8Y0_9AGAR|nr:hypothetical protein BD626DRAFT_538215 [Auriculariopsis ampla]
MLGNHLYEYVFIRTCILALRAIAPLTIIGVPLYVVARLKGVSIPLPIHVIAGIAAAEASFFLFVYLPRKRYLQKHIHVPRALKRAEREELFQHCVHTAAGSTAGYPEGWFLSHEAAAASTKPKPLGRENVREWLLWAFFHAEVHEEQEEWAEEIDAYLAAVEDFTGRPLEEGTLATSRSMRVTLDTVPMVHRPLIWYSIVAGVDHSTALRLWMQGFKHYAPSRASILFPPRLWTPFSRPSAAAPYSYWYRKGAQSSTTLPILFVHGIGIGMYPYIPFLNDLIKRDPGQSILVLELLPICMHITDPLPPRETSLAAIRNLLDTLGISRVVLAAHSYGTVIAAHMLRSPTLRSYVAHVALVDPIPFLLHLPDVAYNFHYRVPQRAAEWQLWYFASRDPDIARTIGRAFFWAENVLWDEDVRAFCRGEGQGVDGEKKRRNFTVVLSGEDQIVSAKAVRGYLTGEEQAESRWTREGGSEEGETEVLFYEGLDHAMVFDTPQRRKPLVDSVSRYAHEL